MITTHNTVGSAAYADTRNLNTAREILKPESKEKKRVILGINDLEIHPKILNYAYELSHRVGGQLEVLQILTPSMIGSVYDCLHNPKLKIMREMGIAYKIIVGLGTFEEDLLTYAQEKRDTLILLMKDTTYEHNTVDFKHISEELNCPIVLFPESCESSVTEH